MALTLEVAVRALFGSTFLVEAQSVGEATVFLMRYQLNRLRSPIKLPASWRIGKNRRAHRERELLEELVYRLITQRKENGNSSPFHAEADGNPKKKDDLLSRLMASMDEDGTQRTPKQLR